MSGAVVTGDAIFTQKEICHVITDGGGCYFFTVKDNQPALRADIALTFGDVPPRPHGRRLTWRASKPSAKSTAAPSQLGPARDREPDRLSVPAWRAGFRPVEGFEYFAEHRHDAIKTALGQRTE